MGRSLGAWITGETRSENRNPSDTGDLVGLYAQASEDQVDEAVRAAVTALPGWSGAGIQARSELLDRIADLIFARKDNIGHMLAREEGKTLSEAVGETLPIHTPL